MWLKGNVVAYIGTVFYLNPTLQAAQPGQKKRHAIRFGEHTFKTAMCALSHLLPKSKVGRGALGHFGRINDTSTGKLEMEVAKLLTNGQFTD